MVYKAGSVVVGNVLRKLDRMADNWQKETIANAKEWEEWYDVFEDTIEPFVAGKAGEVLDRTGMEELKGTIKEAALRYAQEKQKR